MDLKITEPRYALICFLPAGEDGRWAETEDSRNQSQNLHNAILDEDDNPTLTCRNAESGFEIEHELPGNGPPFYRFKAKAGSTAEAL